MKIIENIKNKTYGFNMVALILAIGVVLGGYFIGNGVYQSRTQRTVTVKGLAEMDVIADTAIWNIKINRVGGDLTVVQNGVDSDIAKINEFLKSNGFSTDEIQNMRVQVRDKAAGYGTETDPNQKYVIETGLMVRSGNVALVDSVSRKMGELVRQGIAITEDYAGPIYIFNGLNDVKIAMIEQATKNARDAGLQFAKDANATLGKIQNANQGIFSIEARDPADVWANNEKQSINKKLRVVSTISFYLK